MVGGDCELTTGFASLFALRLAVRLGKAMILPATAQILATWLARGVHHVVCSIAALVDPLAAVSREPRAQNIAGNLAGIVAPIVTGLFVDKTGSFLASASCVRLAVASWVWLVGPVRELSWERA